MGLDNICKLGKKLVVIIMIGGKKKNVIYIHQSMRENGLKMQIMASWKREGAVFKPKGSMVHWKWWSGMERAVLDRSLG